jgi:UV DNA damage endonuclease
LRIGYACQTVGVPHTGLKSCMLKNASESVLLDLIAHNLNALETIIDYNRGNGIQLFRISSDLIPFGSSPVNQTHWWKLFAPKLTAIGEKIADGEMRVSMHPGQYTVLNSPNQDVVKRAVDDLNYHNRVLCSLETGIEHKIVLHVGGVYGDKEQALLRFRENYRLLDETVRQRLVIENDDRSYTVEDVLQLGVSLNIPVVYDNLHNSVNPCDPGKSDRDWIEACAKTWRGKDGPQKIHYAQQDYSKKPGAHSATIRTDEFMDFINGLGSRDIDIMLEVKDKNSSALKCIRCISAQPRITGK